VTYTGRCNCGAVTAMIAAEPLTTRECWCRQCQKIAGGGPTRNAIFALEAITLSGERAQSSYVAASGATLTHEFCPACGTHVLAHSSARPHLRTVRVGLLDEGHGLRPSAAIWLDEAPDWAFIDPALEHWPQQPPPPVQVS
jgi:hypothetical protein